MLTHAEIRLSEREYWRNMVCDLLAQFTLEYLAKEMGVSVRQVSNWRNGDRPIGQTAVKLYLFHMKHGTAVQVDRTVVHGANDASP